MNLSRQLRRACILLAVAATTAAVFQHRPASARAGSAATNAPSAIDMGLSAWRSGRLHEADHWLRVAWLTEPSRHTAARRLRELHETRGFRLGADEIAVQDTLSRLGPGFRRYETRHFVVLSDCEPSWTRTRANILERTRHEFMGFAEQLGLPVMPHERKLLCVLINDHDAYRSFARENDHLDAEWIAGHYSIDANRVAFYNDATSPAFARAFEELRGVGERADDARRRALEAGTREASLAMAASADEIERQVRERRSDLDEQARDFATSKTIHEAVHLLSFNTGVQVPSRAYPLWLSEGLASSFETDEPGQAFGPRFPSPLREDTFRRLLREDRLVPWGELIAMVEPPTGDRVEAVYAQSHVLFSFLARYERDRLASYLLRLGSDAHDAPDAPLAHARLFEESFGPIDELSERLRRF